LSVSDEEKKVFLIWQTSRPYDSAKIQVRFKTVDSQT
jgi:hypothetical protein